MFYDKNNPEEKIVSLADVQGLDDSVHSVSDRKPRKGKARDKGSSYKDIPGWQGKVVEMRERLYHSRSSSEFKRIKKDFAVEEPDACAMMLKDVDIMFSIPKEWEPNETNTGELPDEPLSLAKDTPRTIPEQKYGTGSDGIV